MADTAQYIVNYYLEGTSTPVPGATQLTGSGNTGDMVTVTAPQFSGYTLADTSSGYQSITLSEGVNEVDFYYAAIPSSSVKHILTYSDVVEALRIASVNDIANLELLLSAVDDDIQTATGRDWAQDSPVDPGAKLAASLLFVSLYNGADAPIFYLQKIAQLHAKALVMADD